MALLNARRFCQSSQRWAVVVIVFFLNSMALSVFMAGCKQGNNSPALNGNPTVAKSAPEETKQVAKEGAAQGKKPGLWEIEASEEYQCTDSALCRHSDPPSFVCLTQTFIDKYGSSLFFPDGHCMIVSLKKKTNSMAAVFECKEYSQEYIDANSSSGHTIKNPRVKRTLESSWTTVSEEGRYAGATDRGPDTYSEEYTSVFKSADCGDVKPYVIP